MSEIVLHATDHSIRNHYIAAVLAELTVVIVTSIASAVYRMRLRRHVYRGVIPQPVTVHQPEAYLWMRIILVF